MCTVHRLKKKICESDDNHNEKQMDEYEDVQENIKITKWKRRVKNVVFFFIS